MTNKVDMADICELAHELAKDRYLECDFQLEYYDKENDEMKYTEEGQLLFDKYYNFITSILNV